MSYPYDSTLTKRFVVKITVERCDKFLVSVPQIFDRMKFVALWSAKKKRTTKGYGSAAINQHDIFVLPDGFIEK
jgi:hypothetical protein